MNTGKMVLKSKCDGGKIINTFLVNFGPKGKITKEKMSKMKDGTKWKTTKINKTKMEYDKGEDDQNGSRPKYLT